MNCEKTLRQRYRQIADFHFHKCLYTSFDRMIKHAVKNLNSIPEDKKEKGETY